MKQNEIIKRLGKMRKIFTELYGEIRHSEFLFNSNTERVMGHTDVKFILDYMNPAEQIGIYELIEDFIETVRLTFGHDFKSLYYVVKPLNYINEYNMATRYIDLMDFVFVLELGSVTEIIITDDPPRQLIFIMFFFVAFYDADEFNLMMEIDRL